MARRTLPTRLTAVLVVALALLTLGSDRVRREHDAVLREMHPPGCPAGGLSDLASTPWDRASPVEIATVVEGWHAHSVAASGVSSERVAPCASRVAAIDTPARPGRFADARDVYRAGLRWRGVVAGPMLGGLLLAMAWAARHRVRLRVSGSLAVIGTGALAVENVALSRQVERAWWSAVQRGAIDATRLELTLVDVAALVRWTSYAGVVALVATAVFRPVVAAAGRFLAASRGVRTHVALAVTFALAMTTVPQAHDAVRRWSTWQLVLTLACTLALGAVVALGRIGERSGATELAPVAARWHRRARDLAPLAAAAVVVWGVAAVTGRRGLAIPATVLGALYLLSLPLGAPERAPAVREAPDVSGRRAVLAVAGSLCPAALALLMVGVGASDAIVLREGAGTGRVLVATGLVLLAVSAPFGVGVHALATRVDGWIGASPGRGVAVLGALAVAVAPPTLLLAGPTSVITWAPRFGSIAVFALFLVDVLVLVAIARAAADALRSHPVTSTWAVPPVLRHLGWSRPPVVGLLVVWALGVQVLGPGDYHAVRLVDAAGSPFQATPTVTVDGLVDGWVDRQQIEPGAPLPAVLVGASGGGLRAAYWTAAVLDCIVEAEAVGSDPCAGRTAPGTAAARRARLLMMSGVSGGSLGLVSYVAAVGDGWRTGGSVPRPRWYDARLGADFQAPVLGRMLFGDLPEVLLRRGDGVDRAVVLERAWEAQWPDGALEAGFLEGQHAGEPLLVLSGLDANDGCRFNVSILAANGGRSAGECGRLVDPDRTHLLATADLGDYLCADRDLRRSTAALLSARFPYISPSGRVDTGRCHGTVAVAGHVVDGGYRESAAASPVAELLPAVEAALTSHPAVVDAGACAVPVFVQLDSSESVPATFASGATSPNEAAVPFVAVNRARAGLEAAARTAVLGLFTGPVDTAGRRGDVTAVAPDSPAGRTRTRWFVIAPRPRPGSAAPLGWSLADQTRADLQDQLRRAGDTIEIVRALLDGEHLRCEPLTDRSASTATSPPAPGG